MTVLSRFSFRSRPAPRRAAFLALLALIAAPAALGAQPTTGFPRVPSVIGMTRATADSILNAAGFKVGEVTLMATSQPAGTVIRQSPGGGATVARGTAVSMIVSQGQPGQQGEQEQPVRDQQNQPGRRPVTVPNIVGMEMLLGVGRLALAGLAPGAVDSVDAEAPRGRIVRQSPVAGDTVTRGSRVRLTVSRGPRQAATVAVPNLLGSRTEDAAVLLRRARLALGEADSADSGRPEGSIIRQRPAPGTQVEPGTRVDVTLAAPRLVAVPGLLGTPLADAGRALEGAGLALGPVDSTESARAAGTVVEQRPSAGTLVRPGSRVSLVLAQPRLVAVPDLMGDTLARARSLLTQAGLRAGTVDTVDAAGRPSAVVRQQPAAGTRVPAGTAVRLTVARGTVAVPSLAGRTADEAAALLRRARLARGAVSSAESDSAEGTVIGQSPAAGARVPPGTAVAVTLAGVRLVTVPDVVGDSLGDVRRALAAAGLTDDGVRTVEDAAPAGSVLGQTPAAGERVRAGSGVDLVISSGPPPLPVDTTTQPADTIPASISIPDVVGRTFAEARTLLAAAGFAARTDGADQAADSVVVASQLPAAGTDAPPGTAVVLALAVPVPPGDGGGGLGALPWIIIAVLVAAGVGAVLWRTLRRPAPKPEPEPAPAAKPVPVMRTKAACDPGAPKVDVAGKLVVGPELVLGIHSDAGTQMVETEEPLIAAEVAE